MASKTRPSEASHKPAATPRPSSSLRNSYLLAYNAVSAALWAGVLYKLTALGTEEVLKARKASWFNVGKRQHGFGGLEALGSGRIYENLEHYTRMTQSLAILEVAHSLLGIVRAPLFTTLMQVASRFFLVWGIAHPFRQTISHNPAYATMLLAWSVTEVIRYSYFVFTLSSLATPRLWSWLRYNTFLVLYPLGVASECWCIYSTMHDAEQKLQGLSYLFWTVLATYIPGFYVLFTHMLKQRRRVR